MKIIAALLGGLTGLIGGGLVFFTAFVQEEAGEDGVDSVALCEAQGGAWVYDAVVPLCMTQNNGLLELIDGAFVAFTHEDPWKQPYVIPFAESPTVSPQTTAQDVCKEEEVSVFDGRVAKVRFSSWPEAERYRTAITKDVARGVNFAGSYIVATWGCAQKKGDACVGHAIIHAQTGNIVLYGVLGERAATFSQTSSLFSVTLKNGDEKTWNVQDGEVRECTTDE